MSGNFNEDMPREPDDRILREAAEHFHGKIGGCTVYDPNVCTTVSSPDKPWELVCTSGFPFKKRLYAKHRNRNIRLYVNEDYTLLEVKGPYEVGVVSINAPNKIEGLLTSIGALNVGGRTYPTFGRTSYYSPHERELATLLETAKLGTGESLHFHEDAATAYLKRPSLDRIITLVEAMIELLTQSPNDGSDLDLKKLPVRFHPLIALISRWSITDDEEREELLSSSEKNELAHLVNTVEPQLTAIDSYLDSLGRTPPPEACALGSLAECALEAKAYLKNKK